MKDNGVTFIYLF